MLIIIKGILNLTVSGGTDPGCKRKNNEDYYFLDNEERKLFIVADGMGGHEGGEKASKLAVETAEKFLTKEKFLQIINNNIDIKEAITEAIVVANKAILEESKINKKLKGMGCTLIIAIAEGNLFHIGHVGDVRAYVICKEKISLLTEDHTIVYELIKNKRLTVEESKKHPLKHVLSRAVGNKESVEVLIKPGDYLLLCSDGLTSMLEDNIIKDIIIKEKEPEKIKELLIEKAKEAGGKDNITIILAKIEDSDISNNSKISKEYYKDFKEVKYKTKLLSEPSSKSPWWKFW